MRSRFFITMMGQTRSTRKIRYYWNNDLKEWFRSKDKAKAVSLKEARVYLTNWHGYGVEALLVYDCQVYPAI